MRYHRIPDETVRRLPLYLRGLMVWPKRVKVITLDIAMELARLPYYIPRVELISET